MAQVEYSLQIPATPQFHWFHYVHANGIILTLVQIHHINVDRYKSEITIKAK